jgi:hypothetical protein
VFIVPIKRTALPTCPLDGVREVTATFIALADGRDITKVDATITMIMRTVKMIDLFNLNYPIRLVSFKHGLNTFTIMEHFKLYLLSSKQLF